MKEESQYVAASFVARCEDLENIYNVRRPFLIYFHSGDENQFNMLHQLVWEYAVTLRQPAPHVRHLHIKLD